MLENQAKRSKAEPHEFGSGKEASHVFLVPGRCWSLRARGLGSWETDERKPEGVERE